MVKTFRRLPPLAALLALAAAPLAAAPPAAFDGHWLAEDFLRALEKKRSVVAAGAEYALVALLVDDTPEGRQLSVTNFHEALNYELEGVEQKGAATLLVVDSLDDDTDELERLEVEISPDGRHFDAALWVEEKKRYRRLPATIAETVNRVVLAGTYRDPQGKTWTFGPAGEADFAGKKGRYEVVLDTFEAGCDYLSFTEAAKPDESRLYGFIWRGEKLGLYDLLEDSPDYPIQCADQPLVSLTPKS